MLFLLIFEGGRSGYLIQFLHVFFILPTIQLECDKNENNYKLTKFIGETE